MGPLAGGTPCPCGDASRSQSGPCLGLAAAAAACAASRGMLAGEGRRFGPGRLESAGLRAEPRPRLGRPRMGAAAGGGTGASSAEAGAGSEAAGGGTGARGAAPSPGDGAVAVTRGRSVRAAGVTSASACSSSAASCPVGTISRALREPALAPDAAVSSRRSADEPGPGPGVVGGSTEAGRAPAVASGRSPIRVATFNQGLSAGEKPMIGDFDGWRSRGRAAGTARRAGEAR